MNIKRKLSFIEHGQIWLLVQLYERGIVVHENELNNIINGKNTSPKSKRVIEASENILAREKHRIIKEIEDAFA